MAVRLKTYSHLVLVLGAISKNAMSCWGFSASPQAPAWERVLNCASEITHTWNCIITGQKSSEPHLALVEAFNRPMSAESSANSLMVICNGRKRNS